MIDPDTRARRLIAAGRAALVDGGWTDLCGDDYVTIYEDSGVDDVVAVALAAALRHLAAHPDGYLRYQGDGEVVYARSLRDLADSIEKGEAK